MVGQTVGKYRVQDRVGRGGMGTVYRALDETLNREVAIKVLNTGLNDPGVARRFRSEAVTVARLNHPGIAMVYELFQHDGQWLMVMEFVRGETLESLLSRKGTLPVEQAAEVCIKVLGALEHAHSVGVIHRDLKPGNIMVTDSGAVKITDFGIARVVGTEHMTSAGFMIGTPAYMAPEQVLGQEIDVRADLYSLGVVLYHLTTGKLPFKGDTPMQIAQSRLHDQPTPVRAVRQELPAWLGQVLDTALARSADRRYQTAVLFRDALRRGLENVAQDPAPAADVIPAELLATAAPSSMPIPSPAPSVARSAATSSTPPDEMPTMVATAAANPAKVVDALAAKPAIRQTHDKPSSKMPLLAVAGVVALLIGGVGAWWFMRAPAPAQAPELAVAESAAPSPSELLASESPAPEALTDPNAPVVSVPLPPVTSGTPAAGTAATSSPPPPVNAAGPGASTAPPPPPAAATAPPANATGRSAAPPATAAARGRGRATAAPPVADPHTTFQGLRALVVKGKSSAEQVARLDFYNGQVFVVIDGGKTTLAAIAYKDLARATYVRARDPKWDNALAAPPPDLDIPGGIFRGTRHWLVLQSRTTFMIVRLNDGDFRQVIETITARTGAKVDQPAS